MVVRFFEVPIDVVGAVKFDDKTGAMVSLEIQPPSPQKVAELIQAIIIKEQGYRKTEADAKVTSEQVIKALEDGIWPK